MMNSYSTLQMQAPAKLAVIPVRNTILQRACACGQHTSAGGECEECKQKRESVLQRVAINPSPVHDVPPIVHEVLRSPGQPLDAATRAFMEPCFGRDFSQVRVHTDIRAAASAQAVEARAYTVGRDLFFAAGQYQPEIPSGRHLLAHELVHTLQQATASKLPYDRVALFDETPAGRAAESVADQLASDVLESVPRQPVAAQTPSSGLQRQPFATPRVSVRSPVFEESVTQLSDVAGTTTGRPLSTNERALARGVFGRSIEYSRVRLVPSDALQYRTVSNNIYIPQGFTITNETMAQTLIHELTHVWQYQHGGTSYISISLGTQIAAGIRRGNRNYAYDYRITAGQSFFDFTPEQQGFLVENYFAMQRDRSAIPRDTAAGALRTYESNHLDSTGFKARLSAQRSAKRDQPRAAVA